MFDAVPISTPPGMAPLPTGAYALPLGIPQESNPGCLTQANQYSAWSCKMTFAPLIITINDTTESTGSRQLASMQQGFSVPDNTILYGLQTPILDSQELSLVLDLDYRALGPAYHFSTRYDKLVILRPEELGAGSGFMKRQDDMGPRQRFQVRPGEYPWYCFWNNTYIEGYIYSQDNSSAASFTALPSLASTVTSGPISSSTAAVAVSTAAATLSGVTQTSTATQAAPTPAAAMRRDLGPDAYSPARMAPYPRIVKIEERRLSDSPQPYCQQMFLLASGQIVPAADGSGGPVKVLLQEHDPSYEEYFAAQTMSATSNSKRKDKREAAADVQRRSDPSDACHCQWMFK